MNYTIRLILTHNNHRNYFFTILLETLLQQCRHPHHLAICYVPQQTIYPVRNNLDPNPSVKGLCNNKIKPFLKNVLR